MAGTFFFIIGAAAVILGLAGISLLAAWLQGRLSGDGNLPSGCPGDPTLERCRTCNYMKGMGEGSYCSILSKEIRGKVEGTPDGVKRNEKIH
jgi:hypothetical protein